MALIIICALMLSYAVVEGRWVVCVIYLAVCVFLYNKLERDVYK